MSEELQPIGQVTHFFDRISVAVVRLWSDLFVGDWVHFYGNRTDFVQQIESMQVNHQPVSEGHAEDEIAVQVIEPVRRGDLLYPYVSDDSTS